MLKTYLLTSFMLMLLVLSQQLVDSLAMDRPNKGPRVVITPDSSEFIVNRQNPGDRVLTCQTAGDKPGMFSQLKWVGPNQMDNWEELRKRHDIVEEPPNSNAWELRFVNPKPDDAGEYYCVGTYQSSDVIKASILVKVHNPIKLENCPTRQYLVKGGTNNKITCQISGDQPLVTLSKDDKYIREFEDRYKWDNDALLVNGEVTESDAGQYKIRVKSSATGETVVQIINVEVHTKPEILPYNGSSSDAEFYGVEGEQAILECKTSGNPKPLVYWLDPKLRNVTFEGGYVVNPERGTLQINRVNRFTDHGDFQCMAYNTVGETSRRVSMAVDIRPSIVSFENMTVEENSEAIFECRSTGEPRPTFSIRRQGNNQVPYRVGDRFVKDMDTTVEESGTNVYIHRVKIIADKSHFGFHYCNATNRAGTTERVSQLFVKHKPDLSSTPAEQFVKLGKRLTVTCHIRAYPKPQVTWKVDNTQILNVESSHKTSTDQQTHIITMMPPDTQSAFSRFVCQARNEMGESEQMIIPRYTTAPGAVIATLMDRSPTSVKLRITIPNDGGDRVKIIKYSAEGRTLDFHNPTYTYRVDKQNETFLDASLGATADYTIRNLLPYYEYKLRLRAVNEIGEGDSTEIHIETTKPTRPEPPIIIKPTISSSDSSIPSEYDNGYLLKWGPPDTDNGDPIIKYVIKYNKVNSNSLDINLDDAQQKIVEQMNEKPMYARIGPLEVNQKYRIHLQARNKFGDSEPSVIMIYTTSDRPSMAEFEAQSLAWLIEPSTPVLLVILVAAVVFMLFIDLMFCFCCQIGVTHKLRSHCCQTKTNSVISDKTYN